MKNTKSLLIVLAVLTSCTVCLQVNPQPQANHNIQPANSQHQPSNASHQPTNATHQPNATPNQPNTTNEVNASIITAFPGDNSLQVDILKVDIKLEKNILDVISFIPPSEPHGFRNTVSYEYTVRDKFNNTHDVIFYDDYCFTKKQSKSSIEYNFEQDPKKHPEAKGDKGPVLIIEFKTEHDASELITKQLKPKGIVECNKGGKKSGQAAKKGKK